MCDLGVHVPFGTTVQYIFVFDLFGIKFNLCFSINVAV